MKYCDQVQFDPIETVIQLRDADDLRTGVAVAVVDIRNGFDYFGRAHQLARNTDAAAIAFGKARDLKLRPDQLHPIERVAYQKMLAELK